MKTLSVFMENFESNPGNKLGVTNHLTPIGNIITNVRNFFGPLLGVVIEPAEDGVSLKVHSSRFVSPEEVNKLLTDNIYGSTNLKSYIASQGLSGCKVINLGQYFVVYFYPTDIKTVELPKDAKTPEIKGDIPTEVKPCKGIPVCKACVCTEMLKYGIQEAEIDALLSESIVQMDDEELEDKTREQLIKFIEGTDKVKCAAKLTELLSDDLELPEDYYFKGVKDSDGNESIALRYRFTKRRPFGKSVELSRSLLNIYNTGDEAVWVEAFDNREGNSEEMNTIIETVLKLIGAKPTDDPCVYAIKKDDVPEPKDDEEKKDEDTPEEKEHASDDESVDKKETGDQISGTLASDEEAAKNGEEIGVKDEDK